MIAYYDTMLGDQIYNSYSTPAMSAAMEVNSVMSHNSLVP